MKSTISYISLSALLLSFLVVSCIDDDGDYYSYADETGRVEVKLNLSTIPLTEMTESATRGRAINTTTNLESDSINNLYILQFNGTADTARLVTNPMYIENYNSSNIIKLVASSTTNRLVFVANTFARNIAFKKESGEITRLSYVKEVIRSISKESEVVHTDTLSGGVIKYYPVMCGYLDTIVSSGMDLPAILKHNVARIDVTVENQIPATLRIESVTLKSVPDRMHYFTNYTLPTIFPALADNFSTIDYTPTAWAYGEGTSANTKSFTFYMPANQRGTISENTNGGKLKGIFAPENATYAYIQASYLEGTAPDTIRRSVTYTFYLGANLDNDYNVVPNGHYTYNFVIKTKGDEDVDARVEDSGTKDFCNTELANCYIINPPTASGSWRNFRIPLKRVYDFWKEGGDYEADKNIASSGNGWVMEIIWSDFDTDGKFQLVKNNKKTKFDPANDYFEFSVKEGTVGNVVVGYKRYSDNTFNIDTRYAWSWHLWITDYKPDKVAYYTVDTLENRFSYQVPGGAVHRYNNASFKSKGANFGKVMMDRNLGAPDILYHSIGTSSYQGLYYQFGRKDPFTGPRKIYLYGTTETTWTTGTYAVANTGTGTTDYNNVPYSVYNPLIFITGSYWTYKDKYNPETYDSNIRWQDPKATTDNSKSIFDPCPPGWKVPKNGTWSDFNHQSSGQYDRFIWNGSGQIGRYYYPNGSTDTSSGTIFFPASGRLYSGSGGFRDVGSHGVYWSCSPGNATLGYLLYFNSGGVYPSLGYDRAYGFSVRCVQE